MGVDVDEVKLVCDVLLAFDSISILMAAILAVYSAIFLVMVSLTSSFFSSALVWCGGDQ